MLKILHFFDIYLLYIIGTILLFFLLILSAIISGIEVAYFSLTTKELFNFKNSKNINENKVVHLLNNGSYLLATFIIINNLLNISFVICSTYMLWKYFGKDNITNSVIVTFTISTTLFIIMFGELIPKMYSNYFRLSISKNFSWIVGFLVIVFKPLSTPLIKIAGIFGKNFTPEKYHLSEEQLKKALEITMKNLKNNKMNISEKKILTNIVRFGDLYAKQIMIPRGEIVAITSKTKYKDLLDLVLKSNFSRLPVYENNIDNIIGIVYAKDLLQYINESDNFQWAILIRKPFFIPENIKLDSLLMDFKKERIHMAFILDEYGGTTGLITMEDLIQKIIGDVADESKSDINTFEQIDTKTYIFEGKTSLNDFCRVTNSSIKIFDKIKGDSESLGGLILEINGNLPTENQTIVFKDFNFIIQSVDTRKINKIKVEKKS